MVSRQNQNSPGKDLGHKLTPFDSRGIFFCPVCKDQLFLAFNGKRICYSCGYGAELPRFANHQEDHALAA